MRKDNLRIAMERAGHNVASLAELTGISERTLWRLLASDATVNDDNLREIAIALECSTDFLLGISPDPIPQMRFDNLNDDEIAILRRLRRGERMEAIKIIAGAG